MKILYGITKSNFGGAQRYVFDLALEAKKLGHDVVVMCGGEGGLVEKLKSAGIKVINLPYFGKKFSWLADLRALFSIFKIVKAERPDVLHINSAKMGGAGIFVGRLLKVKKIIFTAHGWAFNENRNWISKLIIKKLSWLTVLSSHKTIAVSEAIKKEMHWPFAKRKMVVIRNGIRDFNLLDRDNARGKLQINDEEVIVGTISELHHIKGLDFLLKAWSRINSGKLIIIGAGEEETNLRALAQELNLGERVDFKGFVDEARSLLKGFDIFTLTSRSEGLPYAILEAGSAELPIVASKVGGIPEVIESGKEGVLVEAGDIDAIHISLQALINNKEKRISYGKSIHEKIKISFSLEKMVRDTLELYA